MSLNTENNLAVNESQLKTHDWNIDYNKKIINQFLIKIRLKMKKTMFQMNLKSFKVLIIVS
jgi:hypothetical protein